MKFCIGCSAKLIIFDRSAKIFFNKLRNYKFYYHISLTYPFTALFFNLFVKNKDRIIAKILGENKKMFKFTIQKTISLFGLNQINIVQITNLPLRNHKLPRTLKNIHADEYKDLLDEVSKYKRKKIISKIYIQLYYSDSKDFVIKILKDFDGVAFTAHPNNLFINKQAYKLIKLSGISIIQLSSFGSIDKRKINILNQKLWTIKCLNFLNNFLDNEIIQVGRTRKIERLKSIYNLKKKKFKSNKKDKINYINDNVFQQLSQNYLHDMKYNYKFNEFLEIIKFLIKRLIYAK